MSEHSTTGKRKATADPDPNQPSPFTSRVRSLLGEPNQPMLSGSVRLPFSRQVADVEAQEWPVIGETYPQVEPDNTIESPSSLPTTANDEVTMSETDSASLPGSSPANNAILLESEPSIHPLPPPPSTLPRPAPFSRSEGDADILAPGSTDAMQPPEVWRDNNPPPSEPTVEATDLNPSPSVKDRPGPRPVDMQAKDSLLPAQQPGLEPASESEPGEQVTEFKLTVPGISEEKQSYSALERQPKEVATADSPFQVGNNAHADIEISPTSVPPPATDNLTPVQLRVYNESADKVTDSVEATKKPMPPPEQVAANEVVFPSQQRSSQISTALSKTPDLEAVSVSVVGNEESNSRQPNQSLHRLEEHLAPPFAAPVALRAPAPEMHNINQADAARRVDQLEKTVAHLESQIADQKIQLQQVTRPQPQAPAPPVVIIQRPSGKPAVSHAFWARSYLGRFHLRTRR